MLRGTRRRVAASGLVAACVLAPLAGASAAGARAPRNAGVVGAALRLAANHGAASVGAARNFKVVATGLNNPRGVAIGPKGGIYVAEAGRGGDGPCVGGAEGEVCLGLTGAITKVRRGRQWRLVRHLPSLAEEGGLFALGPHDVSVRRPARAYFTIGLGANLETYRDLQPKGRALGHLAHKFGPHKRRLDTFLTGYEARRNPDDAEIDSNPFSVLALKGRRYATDAGGNDLLRIDRHGIRTVDVFPDRLVDFNGEQIAMQAVPTSVARGPDGALYVGELTGFPFPVGKARVYRVVPGDRPPEVYARGFTNIIDVAFDPRGRLHVLEIAKNGLLSNDPTGALIRVNRDGSRTMVASEGLVAPGGLAIGPHGRILVSNCSICPGSGTNPVTGNLHGEVVRIPR